MSRKSQRFSKVLDKHHFYMIGMGFAHLSDLKLAIESADCSKTHTVFVSVSSSRQAPAIVKKFQFADVL